MRIFPYYIRGSFTFFSGEEDHYANNNGWAGVVKVATNTGEVVCVCIMHDPSVINGREFANSLVSGTYRNCFSSRLLTRSWNTDETMIDFYLRGNLLLSVPVIENIPQDEARGLCIETSSVIYHLLTLGTYPDAYREDQPVETINVARFRRSSNTQAVIENMDKVDNEILEDAFTCNMLIDRIKNCDTICSGDKKIKIIVREDNKEMMITNTIFDDNILVIDVDNVKEKELDDNESPDIYTSGSLLSSIDRIWDTGLLAYNIGWEDVPLTASNIVTSGSFSGF